jgi:hypothetical protein
MENSKHCEICDLSSFNLQDGIICSLTDRKADFNKKCPDIQLDKKMKEKLIEINTEFQDSKYVKKLAVGHMIFYGLIGLAVLYFCYYLSFKLLELGVFHTGTIVIFAIEYQTLKQLIKLNSEKIKSELGDKHFDKIKERIQVTVEPNNLS